MENLLDKITRLEIEHDGLDPDLVKRKNGQIRLEKPELKRDSSPLLTIPRTLQTQEIFDIIKL